jgi:hemerythrin-like domain-containing protein
MQSAEIVKHEHRVLRHVLLFLEEIADSCDLTGRLNLDDARWAVDFFQSFANRRRPDHEAEDLFPLWEERGFPRGQGPTGHALTEQEQALNHLRTMTSALERFAAGEPDAAPEFVAHTRAYTCLLQQYLRREDSCLFPARDNFFASAVISRPALQVRE